jgi:hypothetical protein
MPNLMSDQELNDLFDKDILDLIGGGDLTPEKKQELYLVIADTVQNRAITQIYASLSEEEKAQLDHLLGTADSLEVQAYLQTKDLDLPAVLTQEAIAYKLEVYELFKIANSQTLSDLNNSASNTN